MTARRRCGNAGAGSGRGLSRSIGSGRRERRGGAGAPTARVRERERRSPVGCGWGDEGGDVWVSGEEEDESAAHQPVGKVGNKNNSFR